jgi:signal transduction histidine kinase
MLKSIVHKDLHNPNHPGFKKASWLSWLLLSTQTSVIAYTLYFYLNNPDDDFKNLTNIFGIVFLTVCILFLKYSSKIEFLASSINLISLIPVYFSIYISGGIKSVEICWVFLTIFSAYMISSLYIGQLISVLTIAYLAVLFWLDQKGIKVYDSSSTLDSVVTISSVISIITVFMLVFAKSLHRAYEQTEKLKEDQIKILEEKLQQKTIEMSLLRSDIAKDFHDEMGNKLASISILAQSVGLKLNNNEQKDVPQMLENIEKRSLELYHGTKDFIWSIDLKSDYVYEIYLYLREFGEVFFNDIEIDFHAFNKVEQDLPHRLQTSASRHLILIVKEIFTNAAKHSKCNQVGFGMSMNDNLLIINIFDNGCGFDTQKPSKRGLDNIKKRCEMLNANLSIDSKNKVGTIIEISIPTQKAFTTH